MGKSTNTKVCERCKEEYQPNSNRQKWCKECGKIMNRKRRKQRCKEYYKRTYKKKGYNQKGKNNNNYKGGIGTYREKKLNSVDEKVCERCGSTTNLEVHYKDRDKYNNNLNNLELICKSCHKKEHMIRDELGRFTGSK